jgi:predicted nucleic-acid-binding protein
MIALDTNILLRYLVQDEPEQAAAATRLIESELTVDAPGFVSVTALLELDWVLRGQYRFSASNVSAVLSEMMDSPALVFEQADAVARALDYEYGDLADNILHHTSGASGCSHTVTFDRKFARMDGVELLKA